MVNERYDDKEEGQEEGEYHFSDDQVNYELDPDASKESAAPVSDGLPSKENILNKLKSRRAIIGVIVFIILLALVYQMLRPTTTIPPTEFTGPSSPAKVSPQPPQQQIQQPTIVASPVQQQPVGQNIPTVPTQPTQQQAPVYNGQPMGQPPQVASVANQPAVAPYPQVNNQTPASVPPAEVRNVNERLAALEQQNAAMMNLIQSQTSQKTATSAPDGELNTKIQELNNRVATLEVAFHQLTRMLRDTHREPTNPLNVLPRSSQPKMSYTVQAIIPGRAWLKSDSGETVTVAEGDVLKDYGRITKIDPYDGIVTIDTGNKVITLSYGNGGD